MILETRSTSTWRMIETDVLVRRYRYWVIAESATKAFSVVWYAWVRTQLVYWPPAPFAGGIDFARSAAMYIESLAERRRWRFISSCHFRDCFTSNDQIVLRAFVYNILEYTIFQCLVRPILEDISNVATYLYLCKHCDKIVSTAGSSLIPIFHVLGQCKTYGCE